MLYQIPCGATAQIRAVCTVGSSRGGPCGRKGNAIAHAGLPHPWGGYPLLPGLAPAAACEVCGVFAPLEDHHLAPRAVFGDDADRWPTVAVCAGCHAEWHRRMGK